MSSSIERKYDCKSNEFNAACKPNASWIASSLNTAIGTESHLFNFGGKSLQEPHVAGCSEQDSTLFIQYSCVQNATEQEVKYNQMALAVGTAFLIAMLYTVAIRYMFQGGKIVQLEWDVATVTAGDFSVEFAIKKENYLHWKENVYRAAGGPFERNEAPAFALKK